MPYLKRNVTQRVRAALADTPVVALNGPRQVGTTTLARGLAFPGSTDYLSLDDESLRKSARLNPLEFLERGATLSSLTRSSSSRGSSVPSSCLSIAIAAPAVFSSPVPVDCSQHPIWPTPLVGRVETIELSPFTQGEVEDRTDQFIDLVFGDRKAVFGTSELRPSGLCRTPGRRGIPGCRCAVAAAPQALVHRLHGDGTSACNRAIGGHRTSG